MNTAGRASLDHVLERMNRQRRTQGIIIGVMLVLVIVLGYIAVYYTATSIAFDHCNAFAIASKEVEPPGFCHAAQVKSPYSFIWTWLPY